jgi:membrane-bound lytic murein transglycosylase A
MAHRSILRVILVLSCGVAISFGGLACHRPVRAAAPAIDFEQALPPDQLALRKISVGQYPDFAHRIADPAALKQSIQNSLTYLSAPSSRQFYPYLDITHDRAVATLHALGELIDRHAGSLDGGRSLNREIIDKFEVYQSIGAPLPDGGGYSGRVLFTGYFTPIYDASLTRTGPYQYPLYKSPPDRVADPNDPEIVHRRLPDGSLVAYYTRREIEGPTNPLAGHELVWLKSRWEAYSITIQGSARLRLADGRLLEIGYSGLNGFAYTSPGQRMIADGVIDRHSAKSIEAYLRAHPDAADRYLWLNQRYVFFTERPGGPYGALNVPVTEMASIATDKTVYPRAMPAFLEVPVPVDEHGTTRAFRGLMLDQDRGGAIRAAGRCDIYMGIGPDAERIAGHQLHQGQLYYLALKPQFVAQYISPLAAR